MLTSLFGSFLFALLMTLPLSWSAEACAKEPASSGSSSSFQLSWFSTVVAARLAAMVTNKDQEDKTDTMSLMPRRTLPRFKVAGITVFVLSWGLALARSSLSHTATAAEHIGNS